MNIIAVFTSFVNHLFYLFSLIQNLHSLTLPIHWLNVCFHGLLALAELCLIFWLCRYCLTIFSFGNWLTKLFYGLGSLLTVCFSRRSPVINHATLVQQVVAELRRSQSSPRRY
jgi:hypothetical protein